MATIYEVDSLSFFFLYLVAFNLFECQICFIIWSYSANF